MIEEFLDYMGDREEWGKEKSTNFENNLFESKFNL